MFHDVPIISIKVPKSHLITCERTSAAHGPSSLAPTSRHLLGVEVGGKRAETLHRTNEQIEFANRQIV